MQELYRKFINNQCSPEEINELLGEFGLEKNNLELDALILNELQKQGQGGPVLPFDLEEKQNSIYRNILPVVRKTKLRNFWPRFAAAATLLIALTVTGYFFYRNKSKQITFTVRIIQPGTNGAILTLANGQRIVLGGKNPKAIYKQSGATINFTSDSLLSYSQDKTASATAFNILETPKNRQIQLILPDQTKVWLNAASSLRYPTTFNGPDRTVELTGEAYFEVRHDNKHPFQVKTSRMLIEDIGTTFNINAYEDEPFTKATLISGVIKVRINHTDEKNFKSWASLKPGQQASVSKIQNGLAIRLADLDDAIAWKRGLFRFNHTDIKTIMRQISRWYDLDIEYQSTVPDKKLSGEFYRSASGNEALQILKYANIPFRMEGKKIIISAN